MAAALRSLLFPVAVLASMIALFWEVTPHARAFTTFALVLVALALLVERARPSFCKDRHVRRIAAVALALLATVLLLYDYADTLAFRAPPNEFGAGVIPVSDANGYLHCALNLIETGSMDAASSRRPLAVGALSLLLELSGQSLRGTLLLQTLVAAACLSVALREVLLRFGFTAAVTLLALTVGHYLQFGSTFMTEPLGFSVGALAFALLLRGFGDRDRLATLAGVLLLSLALGIRAGPTPALPLLAVYAAYHFRGRRHLDWRMLGAALSAAAIPFVFSEVELRVIGPPEHLQQGNLAYTLYGLAVGGKGWTRLLEDHPELLKLTSAESDRLAYGYFWEAYHRDSTVFWKALEKNWWHALTSPFDTLLDMGLPFGRDLFFFPAVLGAIGLARQFLRRRGDVLGFAVIVLAVTFACYPILVDAVPRVYAPTACMHGAVVALGAAVIAGAGPAERDVCPRARRTWMPVAGLAVAGVIGVVPLVFRLAHADLSGLRAPACAPDETPLAYRVARGSRVTVDAASREAFRLQKGRLPGISEGRGLVDGAALVTGLNLLAPKAPGWDYMVIVNPADAPRAGEVALVCGRPLATNPWNHRIYTARIVRP